MFRKKHSLIKGTLILTSAGLVSRVLGFFFRIFLSHTFGEEQVGLYQLIFPFYALCLSLSTSGLSLSLPWPNAGRKVDFPDRSDSFCADFSDLHFTGTEEFRFSFKSFSWRSKMCNIIISDRSCTSGGFCPQLYLWLSLWSAKNLCPGYFTVNRAICSNFFCFCFIFYFYTQWSSP